MPTESPRSTLMFSAQARSYELKVSENADLRKTPTESSSSVSISRNKELNPAEGSSQRIYTLLPKYNTPVRKPIKNPFNDRLIDLFKAPTCSPDFCSSVSSSSETTNKNGEFFWTAEDLWRIDPAPIESPQTDLEDILDEETESLAQEAIDRYFQESHNVLSPIGSPKSITVSNRGFTPDIPTPQCLSDRAMSTPCTRYNCRRSVKSSVATQTTLSFKSDLPDSLMELLKPYMNIIEESTQDLSNTSSMYLRRKLLFNELNESSSDSDEDTNAQNDKKVLTRFLSSDWTPDRLKCTEDMFSKSPDISPIADGLLDKNTSSRSNFAVEMSIDGVTSPSKGCLENDEYHMSIDFGGESTIDSSIVHYRSSQTSGDTGYLTMNKSQQISSKSSSSNKDNSEDKNERKLLINSYIGVTDASTCDTGITSTPTLNNRGIRK